MHGELLCPVSVLMEHSEDRSTISLELVDQDAYRYSVMVSTHGYVEGVQIVLPILCSHGSIGTAPVSKTGMWRKPYSGSSPDGCVSPPRLVDQDS